MTRFDAVVTGCAGFIGSSLIDYLLDKGMTVAGIDSLNDYYSPQTKMSNMRTALRSKSFEFIYRNLLDMRDDEFPEARYIFHLAAQAGVRFSWGSNFQRYVKDNVEATQRLLEAYKERSVKIIYASSSSVYGNARPPCNESYPPSPISPYGVTKMTGEHLCRSYAVNYGLNVLSLRYFTVYGPRQRPDMAMHLFLTSAIAGTTMSIHGNGEQKRDFTYIRDIVRATTDLARADMHGYSVVNIGGGRQISVNELVGLVRKVTGNGVASQFVPNVKGNPKETLADTSRLRKMIKWSPDTDIEDGLREQYEWQRAGM